MMDSAAFDAFYHDAKQRLLHQTYALTGDLPAAQAAVRDSFVGAWHHWRKVSQLDDPERWVRRLAWTNVLRRHGARIWHRDKSADPHVGQALDVLNKLSATQRKVLLLSQLTTGSMDDVAREVGLPLSTAERELQSATALFTTHGEIDASLIRPALDLLQAPVEEAPLPRPSIIRRAGTTRRRTHTLIGVAASVGVLVASGLAVSHGGKVRPQLVRQQVSHSISSNPVKPVEQAVSLSPDNLLAADQVLRIAPRRRWQEADTSDNVEGNGRMLPCQQGRFADPGATDTLVRTFTSRGPKRPAATRVDPVVSAMQAVELSRSTRAARKAYLTTAGWYAGCVEDRVQLLSTQRVDGVGNDAALLVLRSWADSDTTMVVGVARSGRVITTTLSQSTVPGPPDLAADAALLAASVNSLCGSPGSGDCAGPPHLVEIPPLPTGAVPGMLSAVDLPPVSEVEEAWVGTEPRKAMVNTAATQCDSSVFTNAPMSNALTRTFLFPQAQLPDTFGLTETVGTLPRGAASSFVENVRRKMTTCEDRNPGTTVTRVDRLSTVTEDLTVWNLSVEISDQQTLTYLMGIVRSNTAVAQIGFTPTENVQMAPGDFKDVVARALERLDRMPAPVGAKN